MHNHIVVSHDGQLRIFGLMLLVVLLSATARHTGAQNDNNSGSNNSNAAQGGGNNNSSSPNNNRKPDQPPAPSGTPVKSGDTSDTGTQAASNDPEVTSVTGNLALYNTVTIKVKKLQELLKQADVENKGLSQIILHLDGYPLKDLPVRRVSVNGPGSDELQYDLKRTDDPVNVKSWNSLLGRPVLFPEPKTRPVRVSVGLENRPINTAVAQYPMTVVNYKAYWVYVIGLVGLVIGLWYLAWKSDLLRDPGPDPPVEKDINGNEKPKKYKPYSLARTQMAMWFFVIIASYIFIWMVTSNVSSLTSTVLGLIGISAGTGLGSALIDSNKRAELDKKKEDLDKEGKTLEVQITQLNSEIGDAADAASQEPLRASLAGKTARLTQVKKELAALDAADKPLESDGFLRDILSDNNGVNFHRFQIFVWTIALIVIFIASVYNVLTMPDFDGTLLALMGISSGTYLGFKVPEARTPPKDDISAATTTTTTTTPDQQATKETKK